MTTAPRVALIYFRKIGWVLLGLALACCDDEPFVGYVSRSTYFEYHNQVDEPLCPTLLPMLDLHAEMIGAKLGLSLDPDDPVRYYKFRDREAYLAAGRCPSGVSGCAEAGAVYSTRYFHAHEQVHAFATRAWGWSIGLLMEGMAVALSCEPAIHLQPGLRPVDAVGELDWRDLLGLQGSDANAGNRYLAAGFFVTHLVNKYGWESVEVFYRNVPSGASVARVEAEFADVFSTSIDQEWDEVMNLPQAPSCNWDWACMATELAPGEAASPDCDGEMHRRIDVAPDGGVVLTIEGEDTQLMLLSCGQATPTPYMLEGALGRSVATHWASLPPGSYTLMRGPDVGLPGSVTFRAQLSGPLVGSVCPLANTVSLDESGSTTIDFVAGPVDGWMRLNGGGATYHVSPHDLWWVGLQPGPISICTDCTASSCVPLPFNGAADIVITDQSVVRFQNVAATPSPTEAWSSLVFQAVTAP